MAFNSANLFKVAELGGARSFWSYETADVVTDVDGADYFLSAIGQLRVGDLIYVLSGIGGTPAYGFVVVNGNSGTSVDTTNVTAFTVTDSD